MATLTEEDKKKIKDSVIASCVAKGIKPTVQTSTGVVPNPLYANCVQLGYDDALKHASQGKLGQWFSKVNSYVQSQGGIIGLIQSASSIAAQYRGQTANVPGSTGMDAGMNGAGTQFPPGYDQAGREERDNTSLWLVMIILLLVLIVATVFYFSKKKVA